MVSYFILFVTSKSWYPILNVINFQHYISLVVTVVNADEGIHLDWVNGSLDMKKQQGDGPSPRNFKHQGKKIKMAAGSQSWKYFYNQITKNITSYIFLWLDNIILVAFLWFRVKKKTFQFYIFYWKTRICVTIIPWDNHSS